MQTTRRGCDAERCSKSAYLLSCQVHLPRTEKKEQNAPFSGTKQRLSHLLRTERMSKLTFLENKPETFKSTLVGCQSRRTASAGQLGA